MFKKINWFTFLFILSFPSLGQYRFIENKNQWDQQAKLRAELPGGFLFMEQNSLSYLFYDPSSFPQHHDEEDVEQTHRAPSHGPRGHVVKVNFLGANANPTIQTAIERPEYYNFLYGTDPTHWGQKAKAFEESTYKALYPNIDLKFYTKDQDLKYEFIVHPSGDASNIQVQYDGQDQIYLEDGHLYVQTSVNAFREAKPYCYQLIAGLELEIESEFRLDGNVLTYHFPQGYDSRYPLIIDPTLIFSSYSGSFQDNWGFTAAPDDDGHFYAGGMAYNTGQFPTTAGAFQETAPSGGSSSTDIAIMKYTPDGTAVVYATYLGGTLTDLPHSLIVNSQNQLVVLGSTSSTDFPTSTLGYDQVFNGGSSRTVFGFNGLSYVNGSDMFITVLSEDGSSLVGSSYFGGTANDGLNPDPNSSDLTFNYGDEFRGDMILDDNDNIYICSVTESADFPTSNPIQSTLLGSSDAVIAKFNPTVSTLEWSTYLGGANEESAYGIRLSNTGQVIITGGTSSTDFPTTSGVVHENFQGGSTDGFITILDAGGSTIEASTFLGTSSYDQSYLVDTDEFGNIGVFGQTLGFYPISSPDLFSVPKSGQFIHMLNPDLTSTIFSTVIGSGSPFTNVATINIRPTAFLINDCSQIYLAGWGGSTNAGYANGSTNDMPITGDAQQSTTDGSDFYLMILSADGERLLYATYFGATSGSGDHVDGGTARFDKKGVVYQSVCSCGAGATFPTTPGVVSNVNNAPPGRCNNAAFKFDFQGINADVNPTIPDDGGVFVSGSEGCAPLEVIFTNDSLLGNEFEWDFGDGTTTTVGPINVTHTYTVPGSYPVTVRVVDSATCQIEDVAIDTIDVFPADFTLTAADHICQGDSTQFEATGGSSYQWSPSIGLSDDTVSSPYAFPEQSTTYSLLAINEFGCEFKDTFLLEVTEINSDFDTSFLNPCDTLPSVQISTISNSTTQSYTWSLNGQEFNPDSVNSYELNFGEANTFDLTLITTLNGCFDTTSVTFDVEFNDEAVSELDVQMANPPTICQGESVPLTLTSNGSSYLWSPTNTLDDPRISSPVATPSETTDYQVRIFTDKPGCFLDTNQLVTVIPEVTLDFGFEWSNAECGEFPIVAFTNTSTGTEQFTWTINGQQYDGRIPPVFEPNSEDTIEVTLVAGDPLCSKTGTLQVPIKRFGVPPNAFSPNGDGINDTFEIEGLGDGWALIIYDRWGKKVYESTNYQGDWAGGDNGGETFYYLLTSPAGSVCKGYIHVLKGAD